MISVIIPIYKVEKYLDTCVQSVFAQTYQDLEIILVDDGSEDRCPAMCDQYALEDSRVKVIHKKNGGLSDARNAGIEIASGEYISFVDSDDYIHPKMYENLVKIMEQEQQVDVVVCPFQKVQENENDAAKRAQLEQTDMKLLSRKELIEQMFQQQYEMYIVAWNKLYRRKVWDTLRFPFGRIHEDQFTTYKALYEAGQVAFLHQPLYYYRQRGGSIMSKFNEKGCMDDIAALQEKMEYFSDKDPWEYGCCVSRSLEHMIYHYKKAKQHDAMDTADRIRGIFEIDWKQVRNKKLPGITKERIAYFNSFLVSDTWMKLHMNIYWKRLGIRRKIKRVMRKK